MTDIFMQLLKTWRRAELCKALLTSNEPSYVRHSMSVFEEMWENAVDANEAIRNIEKGIDADKVEPHTSDNEEDMKAYLNEVLKEIRRIMDSHRLSY
jgi:hypothetical protein